MWGHDTGAHLFRLVEVARGLSDGILYPRFLPDAYGGLGGPILNFNPVAPYYLPALLVLSGIGPIAALKIVAGLLMVAGGLAMRVLARPHAGRAGAAVAGLAYIFFPYRIADLYVRMAYSELAAMVVLPLAMASARRAVQSPAPRRLATAGLLMGALPMVHFPASVLGLPLVAFYALGTAKRGGHLRAAGRLGICLVLALLAGAFSWLPALVEIEGTHYRESTGGLDNYSHHFVGATQFLSPRWGFGSSMPGAEDQMSFQIGWVHLLALAALLTGARLLVPLRPLAAFSSVVVGGGTFLMLGSSRWIWDRLPVLQNVQFPWRILMLTGIATSLCAGLAAVLPAMLAGDRSRRGERRGGGGWAGLLPATGRGSARILRPDAMLARGRLASIIPVVVMALVVGACLPYLQTRKEKRSDEEFTPQAIRQRYFGELKFQPKEVATLRFRPSGPRATLLAGGRARILHESTHRFTVEVESPVPTSLRLHVFNSPGWKARMDGAEASLRSEPRTALILVDVPSGSHRVHLRYTHTPVRWAGWILSGTGLATVAGLMVASRRTRRQA
jgi:hypothetical protein